MRKNSKTTRSFQGHEYVHHKTSKTCILRSASTVSICRSRDVGLTFILKNVILVSKSTVDFRSWRRARSEAGKLFCREISVCKFHFASTYKILPSKTIFTLYHTNLSTYAYRFHYFKINFLLSFRYDPHGKQHLFMVFSVLFIGYLNLWVYGHITNIWKFTAELKSRKLYFKPNHVQIYSTTVFWVFEKKAGLTLYMERSIRRELWSWSNNFTNFSFWKTNIIFQFQVDAKTIVNSKIGKKMYYTILSLENHIALKYCEIYVLQISIKFIMISNLFQLAMLYTHSHYLITKWQCKKKIRSYQ